MNDVAEKLLELVERRRTLLDEVARIEAAFALALANVEKPKLLGAVPKTTVARKSSPGDGDQEVGRAERTRAVF